MSGLGVLVAGGPAPGINSVISAVVRHTSEKRVFGFYEGFGRLLDSTLTDYRSIGMELTQDNVAGIHLRGGNILQQSRENLLDRKHRPDGGKIDAVVRRLRFVDVDSLVTIGGDDTAYSAFLLAQHSDIKVVHVPKTIDNDLPIGRSMPTFGFTSAVEKATEELIALVNDAHATNRWYVVVIMGRTAGHLALESSVASGVPVVMIPEQFDKKQIGLGEIIGLLEDGMFREFNKNRAYGVAVVAEGIGYMIDPKELRAFPGVKIEEDEAGHLKMSEVPLASILKQCLTERRKGNKGQKTAFVAKEIGYELRSADPCAFDVAYTQTLGYAAVQAFESQNLSCGAVMVTLDGGEVKYIPLVDTLDSDTGKIAVRFVNRQSALYKMVFG